MQLFISYSRFDKVLAQRLADDLGQRGYAIWLDVRSIPHGANWDNEVQRGLDTSDVMVLLLSPTSAASPNVADEWSYFIERNKRILPIMAQMCDVPFRLSRRQRVDFIQGYDQGFVELLHALNEPPEEPLPGTSGATPASKPVIPPSPPPAPAPVPRQPSAATLDSQPTLIVRPDSPVPVAWAEGYKWWRGLAPEVITGDSLIRNDDWRLIGMRRLPLIIALDNILKAQVIRTAWDTYLTVSYRDNADQIHQLVLSDPDRKMRAVTVNTLHKTLVQATSRSLN
jgi:hypothetical protein